MCGSSIRAVRLVELYVTCIFLQLVDPLAHSVNLEEWLSSEMDEENTRHRIFSIFRKSDLGLYALRGSQTLMNYSRVLGLLIRKWVITALRVCMWLGWWVE
ncbi:hypothetical protein B0J17DRAFT_433003 [Rhizoctonia solani]|nr:hypothetical protein B0J17DRAFT_433003 [Rhizoctonia solani]